MMAFGALTIAATLSLGVDTTAAHTSGYCGHGTDGLWAHTQYMSSREVGGYHVHRYQHWLHVPTVRMHPDVELICPH
jgi:hypothetical protein